MGETSAEDPGKTEAQIEIPTGVPADMVVEPDPHEARRVQITEKEGIHKAWPAEARAVRTIEEFVAFHDKIMNGYAHDYGTICHAIAAVSLAGACLADHDKVNGGITGYQAGAIMWEWLAGWGTGPKKVGRMLDYEQMLYPVYEHKFNQLSWSTWKFLQEEAAKSLADPELAHAAQQVKDHWQSIVDGKVPFGYTVDAEPKPKDKKED